MYITEQFIRLCQLLDMINIFIQVHLIETRAVIITVSTIRNVDFSFHMSIAIRQKYIMRVCCFFFVFFFLLFFFSYGIKKIMRVIL